jgi:ribose 5-phosphate isomerase B
VIVLIAIASDHGGYLLKEEIIAYFEQNEIKFVDFGTNSTKPTDYPIYAKKVCNSIISNECNKGILICGTGIGISITANKMTGIRCALCHDVFSAKATRQHNDANIIAMGARVIGGGLAIEIIQAFLSTDFSNEERHINRINQIEI